MKFFVICFSFEKSFLQKGNKGLLSLCPSFWVFRRLVPGSFSLSFLFRRVLSLSLQMTRTHQESILYLESVEIASRRCCDSKRQSDKGDSSAWVFLRVCPNLLLFLHLSSSLVRILFFSLSTFFPSSLLLCSCRWKHAVACSFSHVNGVRWLLYIFYDDDCVFIEREQERRAHREWGKEEWKWRVLQDEMKRP